MAHTEQIEFLQRVKKLYPHVFKWSEFGFGYTPKVLDIGSMDINGNNRYLFSDGGYIYTGIDLAEGKNVDIVRPNGAHTWQTNETFDVVISTECLEHDKHYKKTLAKMTDLLVPGGLMLITCATHGRAEHGTYKTRNESSPYTLDYYKNLGIDDLKEALDLSEFHHYGFEINKAHNDIYFFGFKNEEQE